MQEASSWCENSFHSFTYYLRQGGVMRSGRFVCYSVCVYRITAKVVSRFHWNLFVTIESSNRKNRLIFWWWSRIRIPDQFSTSLTIAEQGILGDLLAFLIQSRPDFHDTRRNDWCQQDTESTTFWERSESGGFAESGGFESRVTFGWG